MYCSTCGTENPATNNYCLNDGTILKPDKGKFSIHASPAATFCSGCGSSVSAKDNYCLACGSTLHSYQKTAFVKDGLKPASTGTAIKSFSIPKINITILKPAIISSIIGLVLVLILSFGLLQMNTQAVKTAFSQDTDVNITYLIESLREQTGMDLPEPGAIIGLTDMMMMSHLVSAELDANMDSFDEKYNISIKLSFGLVFILLIPAIALFVSGIVHRNMTGDENPYSLLYGAASTAILYGILLAILSLFSGFSYDVKNATPKFLLDVSTSYSFFGAFLKGTMIAFLFSMLGMLFSLNYRRVTGHLRDMFPFGDALHQGISTFFRGFIIFSVVMIFIVQNTFKKIALFAGEFSDAEYLTNLMDKSFSFILAIGTQLGALIWNLASFGSFTASTTEGMDVSTMSYSMLSGLQTSGDELGSEIQLALAMTDIGLYIKFAALVLVGLFVWSGYSLSKNGMASIKSLAVYSLVYSILFALFTYFAKIQFIGEAPEHGGPGVIEMMIGFGSFAAFLKAFIFAFLCAYAGTFIRKWRS
ncbi:zinc ribbon domain-containing protein [Peribacillus glennii]|uniref:DZANK-type domain-containing protein n=1 Tax=Peribacillus glennii TaxID=2303991 RepID=A0A372L799_9BACI|nr:zinc ribbon domain-containing protein [Peribacillus glennii]RFU61116.1 hypothetical protein D0466_19220 [Peribacillus glennii]